MKSLIIVPLTLLLVACGAGDGGGEETAPPQGMQMQPANPMASVITGPMAPGAMTGGANPADMPAGGAMQSGQPPVVEDNGGGLILDVEPADNGLSGGFLPSEKLDLLFVIDNSSSMADKQEVFKAAIPDLIDQMVNPPCIDTATKEFVPYDPMTGCPGVSSRIFKPVTDIHIGLLSSSLGSLGTVDNEIPPGCSDDVLGENDRAWLLGRIRPALLDSSYQNWGFLVWDPEQKANPAGDADFDTLIGKFIAQIDEVGESGCGFEAPLEAAYRFLSEPDPYQSLNRVLCAGQADGDTPACVELVGTDEDLLLQREQFLRPDSVVVVMFLTDENDCSLRAKGQGFLAMSNRQLNNSTNACDDDPNSECCKPCGATLPASCNTDPMTNGCMEATIDGPEARQLRCYDQVRRFGADFLRSTDVYVGGYINSMVADRNNMAKPNALFTSERGRDKIFVVGIVGVPWQDTARDEDVGRYDLIEAKDVDWARFLPAADGTGPTDPFNVEGMAMRSGTHPLTGDVLGGPGTWNEINGHDRDLQADDNYDDDLQYACIFPLPAPRPCEGLTLKECDCVTEVTDGEAYNYWDGNPLCYDTESKTYSETQYYAKAYPAPRMLKVLRGVSCPPDSDECEDQSVLASICPRQLTEEDQQDFGYRPVIRALLLDLAGIDVR